MEGKENELNQKILNPCLKEVTENMILFTDHCLLEGKKLLRAEFVYFTELLHKYLTEKDVVLVGGRQNN